MRLKLILISVILLMFSGSLYSQLYNERRPVEISGIVVSNDKMEPIENVAIKILHKSRGTVTDKNGRFLISVNTGDTLRFSHVSYRKSLVSIQDSLKKEKYFIVKTMSRDTISLPEAIVLPWSSKQDFIDAIVNVERDKDVEKATENLKIFQETMKAEWVKAGNEAPFKNDLITTAQRESYYKGQVQPFYFLDIGTWYRLIKSIKAKQKNK